MKTRGSNVATRLARQRARKLRAREAFAELELAQKVLLTSDNASGHHLNDDKSPLIDLLTCIVCKRTMKLENAGTKHLVTNAALSGAASQYLIWCEQRI